MPTREWVATEIGIRLATPLAGAGMTADDAAGSLKEPIDDALRLLSYAEVDIPTAVPDDASGFLALVRWTALKAILERISSQFDLSTGGNSFRLSQVVANVEKLLALAEVDVLAIFGSHPAEMAAEIVSLDLAYLAPNGEREYYG